LIFQSEQAKFRQVVQKISEIHQTKQPILVGTSNIETSEYLSSLLKKSGIKHNVLNAKNHEKEAEIISDAGQLGSVTIATNMAGRGTDIKLGEGVNELGGLFVIGTEKHESRRIDNQLRGRSGRQGDNGETVFYLSLEDDIMRRFGSESVQNLMAKLNLSEDEKIENRIVTKSISSAQKRVEGNNFDTRKRILDYDDVLNKQRNIIYSQRREVLFSDNLQPSIEKMLTSSLTTIVHQYTPSNQIPEEWDLKGLETKLLAMYFPAIEFDIAQFVEMDSKEIITFLHEKVLEEYARREAELSPEHMREFEKVILLKVIDEKWIEHIDTMDQLRQGIHLRSYGQNDPLREYQNEGFELFESLIASIHNDVSMFIMKAQLRMELVREQVAEGKAMLASDGEEQKKKPFVNKQKIGRNEPCYCGSGKKFKNCHGKA